MRGLLRELKLIIGLVVKRAEGKGQGVLSSDWRWAPSAARPVFAEGVLVIGLGIDLVELPRVEKALGRWGARFVDKLMGEAEASRLPTQADEKVTAVALAIAGKEAASKALGTGWSQGVQWRQVVVTVGASPAVSLEGRAIEVARSLGSSGDTRVFLDLAGDLAVGEVWLLK
jgi:holo-[acyl-carrier protein] synthase